MEFKLIIFGLSSGLSEQSPKEVRINSEGNQIKVFGIPIA